MQQFAGLNDTALQRVFGGARAAGLATGVFTTRPVFTRFPDPEGVRGTWASLRACTAAARTY